MKILLAFIFSISFAIGASAQEPISIKSKNWEFIVNNALRTLDERAVEKNPNAVFIGSNVKTEFLKQYGGEYKGRYLLKVLNESGGHTSFGMLLPLFDEFSSSENIDDRKQLWKVVTAKYDGRDF
ncbi:hypothetical protein [Teredinibacter turnerae]|uniref:hypothetical protein n=1 Tax=Teredinibacter turnerae TaxID=2426 RepID=UPI00035EAD35|nr:hypothetical protein [Teredinibacter turnerae]